jgi:dTDP-4-dehydrorhamnose reductase
VVNAAGWWIVRTSWLYDHGGDNFVTKMAKRLRAGEAVRVVDDQVGRPTYARDLAVALLALTGLAREGRTSGPAASGIYHAANDGEATWYALTLALATHLGCAQLVSPITTAEYPTAAVRPAYSVLSCEKLAHATGHRLRLWPEALAACVQKLEPAGA